MNRSRRQRIASILLSTTEAELEVQKLDLTTALKSAETLQSQADHCESEWARLHQQMITLTVQGSLLPLSILSGGQSALCELSEQSGKLAQQLTERSVTIENLRSGIQKTTKRRQKLQEVIAVETGKRNAHVLSRSQRLLEDIQINRSTT